MSVPEKLMEKIRREILEYSPEMEGVEPEVEIREDPLLPRVAAKLGIEQPEPKKVFIFTFKKTMTADDGAEIPIVSMITTDEEGDIIEQSGN